MVSEHAAVAGSALNAGSCLWVWAADGEVWYLTVEGQAAEGVTGVTATVSIAWCAEDRPSTTGLGRAAGRSCSNGLSTPKSMPCSTKWC